MTTTRPPAPEITAEQARRLIAAAAGHNINPVTGPQTIGDIIAGDAAEDGLGIRPRKGACLTVLPARDPQALWPFRTWFIR